MGNLSWYKIPDDHNGLLPIVYHFGAGHLHYPICSYLLSQWKIDEWKPVRTLKRYAQKKKDKKCNHSFWAISFFCYWNNCNNYSFSVFKYWICFSPTTYVYCSFIDSIILPLIPRTQTILFQSIKNVKIVLLTYSFF